MRYLPYLGFAGALLGSYWIASCKDDPSNPPPPPPPPRHCATAMECLSIRLQEQPIGTICPTNPQATIPVGINLFYYAYDFDNSRNIIATLRQTQKCLSCGQPDYSPAEFPVRVLATPKGTLQGGPDNADTAGPANPLNTCEYGFTPGPFGVGVDTWRYLYTPIRACFEDDQKCIQAAPSPQNPPGPPPSPPTPSVVLGNCDNECKLVGGNCSKESVGNIPAQTELSNFERAIVNTPPPTTQNIVSLLQLLASPGATPPTPVCNDFRDMDIDSQDNVTAIGNPCTFRFRLGSSIQPSWYAVFLNTPAVIMGSRHRTTNEATITLDPDATITARIFASQNADPKSDPITALRARPGELLFAGQRQFCALIQWEQH
jgi:hypothetical protein